MLRQWGKNIVVKSRRFCVSLVIITLWLVGCRYNLAYPIPNLSPTITSTFEQVPYTFQDFIKDATATNLPVQVTERLVEYGFTVKGKVVDVGTEFVVIHEFSDTLIAHKEALGVSTDGYTITRTEGAITISRHGDWIKTPHFYQKGQLIVVYAGDNETITNMLTELLGKEFAGGKLYWNSSASPYPTP